MKLLFDLSGRILNSSITVYSKRLLKGFQENKYKNITILCSPEIYNDIRKSFPEYPCIKANTHTHGKHLYFKNCLNWRRQANTIDYDIIFSPHPEPFHSAFSKGKKIIVFHDLQGLRIWKGKTLWRYHLYYIIALIKSYKIITISEYVKNDIIKTFPFIPSKKLHTIYNGILFEKNISFTTSPYHKPYILYVSTLLQYKNVITLIKAFNNIKDKIDQNLVIIGKPTSYWNNVIKPLIKKNHIENRVIHISERIDESTLALYYQHADLFVHPSLFEGFGYTPIEAAIYETPVISSKETALYETTKGLLNYYAPATNDIKLAQKIYSLIKNPPSKKDLKRISQLFQQQYNNTEQAKKLYQYLETVYKQSL